MHEPIFQAKAAATAAVVSAVVLVALLLAGPAQAEVVYESSFGAGGAEAGQFSRPAGVAIDNSTEDVYVADRNQHRIQQFSSAGVFKRMWGFDVVASGEDNQPFADEVDKLTLKATGGVFNLRFEGSPTGGVAIGDLTNGSPVVSQLVTAAGTANLQEGTPSFPTFTLTTSAGEWVAGQTITGPGIQAGTTITSINPSFVGLSKAPTATGTAVPLTSPGPYPIAVGQTIVGSGIPPGTTVEAASEGALTLSANATASGTAVPLAAGIPYNASAGQVQSALNAVPTVNNGGGSVSVTGGPGDASGSSPYVVTFDGGPWAGVDVAPLVLRTAGLEMPVGAASRVATATNGGPVFEVCKANPPSTDVCKAGVPGGNTGQLSSPRGVAVDNSSGGSGDIYVVDDKNNRIQKFSATGTPVLMFGEGVNATTGGDLCTAASGDACGTGTASTDLAPGHFAALPEASEFGELGEEVSVDGDGDVYVGDVIQNETQFSGTLRARIQKFSPTGVFLAQVPIPKPNTNSALPLSVDVDSQGRVFTTLAPTTAIEMFEPSEFAPDPPGAEFADAKRFDKDRDPRQLAINPVDDKLWISDANFGNPVCGPPASGKRVLVAFDAEGRQLDCSAPAGSGELPEVTGLAVSPESVAYVAVGSQNVIKKFKLPEPQLPDVLESFTKNVTTETAKLRVKINPGFELTTYGFEYGKESCASDACTRVVADGTLNGHEGVEAEEAVEGLEPGTKYHYVWFAENSLGEVEGTEHTFTTFPFVDLEKDPCPNALARKQTKTAGLDDCRAYELASAEFTGGYDVESDLIPGQTPFAGYPQADGKLLYAVHDGGIPNTGLPTNRGPDPYVATRDAENQRWTTKYMGIPANAPSTSPFSSTLAGADSSLQTLAFGGSEICDPCFADGSAGMPVRMPDGSLVQGMVGSIPVLLPEPAGEVDAPLSDDGSHFVFGSMQQFEDTGNTSGTDVTFYERDLQAGATEVVSTLPDGSTIEAGEDVVELGVSADGSRVLIGELLNTVAGNRYWHLYMHLAGSAESIDLTPGASAGAAFAGMTSDGTKVFFTTRDPLDSDSDTSFDLYRADVSGSGSTLNRVSTGAGDGDTDECDPAANSYNTKDWNTIPGGPTDCSVVAIGGGGGVAVGSGKVYFLSPEQLDGDGVVGAPNLFVSAPGSTPHFVATLESGASTPVPPALHPFLRSFGSFTNAQGAAIDPVTGATYVWDPGETEISTGAYVQKFDASGNLDESFGTGGKVNGSESATGEFISLGNGPAFGLNFGVPVSIAVDAAPSSPSYRDVYVADLFNERIDKFGPSGNYISQIKTSPEPPSSVAVNPANGHVYMVGLFGGGKVYDATGSPVAPTSFSVPFFAATDVGVDSTGKFYVTDGSAAYIYDSAGNQTGTLDSNPSSGVTVDPADDHVYVDERNQVVEFDPSGNQIGAPIGTGDLSESVSLAADSGRLAITNKTNVRFYGPSETKSSRAYDSPLVIDSVRESGARHLDEFQGTRSGDDVVFPTTLPLTGVDSATRYQVFRYDTGTDEVDCVSCIPSESVPTSDAALPSRGLGVTANGRVFFNTREQLVMRDTNGKEDAYEWQGGAPNLISTGSSLFDAGLLSVTEDGRDAYFFTRDTLVAGDVNGQAMKIYDAREEGGFFRIPPTQPCAASDECHGPSSQAAPPHQIGTFKGGPGQATPRRCRRGFVKKHGKCVRKQRKHRTKKRAGASRGGRR